MRSSAAFPMLHKPGKVTSVYTFMGYWLRKRNIPLVSVLVTLRTTEGEKISVRSIEVNSMKSYVISSYDILESSVSDFVGSIEIEVFSAVDMVFPYPAITWGLKSDAGLTFVHTCGRIYNDFDDMNANTEKQVPETGFDLYMGDSYLSFFSFINGPIAIKDKEIELEYIDTSGSKVIEKKKIDDVKPYGLGWVELNSENKIETDSISKRCVKIRHNFEGFFPRFVAGNIFKNYEAVSLTHSYYDTSVDLSQDAVWKNSAPEEFLDGVVAIPFDTEFSEIELAIYPNFAYAPVDLTFELYSPNGELIDTSKKSIKIANGNDQLMYIKFIEMFSAYKEITNGMVRVVFDGDGSTPARMKFGLNFSHIHKKTNLPSNICFNANVPNKKLLKKPSTFHWCSLFDVENQKIFLHNTSFVKKGFRNAKVNVEVCRQSDAEKLEWTLNIPYNGTVEVLHPHSEKIKQFLDSELGWVSLDCMSPFIYGYYITDFKKGVVGADHVY